MENYEQAVNDLYTTKDRETATVIGREARRRHDPETFVYAYLVEHGPFNGGEGKDKLAKFLADEQEGFGSGELQKAYEKLSQDEEKVFSGDWVDVAQRPVPSQPQEILKSFVLGYLEGRIYTCFDMPDRNLIEMVFLPIVFGALRNIDPSTIGVIYENLDQAGPRSINGMPSFFSCRLLNVEDWERARKAINRELERREEIEV